MTEAAFLPYGRQTLDEADVAAVCDVLQGDWLTGGPSVARFEEAFARAVDAPHAVACSSGTAALHLAALALKIRPGDAIVVPSVTFLASANAFRFEGADILFADVDPHTGLMTRETCAEAIARAPKARPRAIVPVHLGGRCAPVAEFAAVAASHGAALVEDACHALGTDYDAGNITRRVGDCAVSAMTVFSLHPVKTATMGEGGVVTTRDAAVAARLARLRSHGIERTPDAFVDRTLGFDARGNANPWYYEMQDLAPNYRASDLNCALGASQIAKLPQFAARQRALAARYAEALVHLDPLVKPNPDVAGCDPVLHLYAVHIDYAAAGVDRAEVVARLKARGIGTQVHYIPVHLQPYYRAITPDLRLPGAEAYYASTLSLPLFPAMSDSDVDRVVDVLGAALGMSG